MSSHHPYYRRVRPMKKREEMFVGDHIDFSQVHLDAFGEVDPVVKANAQFDDRVAAVLRAFAGLEGAAFWEGQHDGSALREKGVLERKVLIIGIGSPTIVDSPTKKCLAILAYPDYFVTWGTDPLPAGTTPESVAQSVVSKAILASNPGWCGTFGPGVDSATDVLNASEGNYDMTQMHLLPMAYRYYDDLTPEAQEHLITSLLAGGVVHGPGNDDTRTSGFFRETWSRAGMVSPLGVKRSIGETENHILTIMTARYLTNQLLYQRDPQLRFDNRRNSQGEIYAAGGLEMPIGVVIPPVAPHKQPSPGSCTFLLLDLLQRILRDDFSEYNAKSYQQETRWALVNLCNYAYDQEIRLAARMVLDYISAHFSVSTNDLRRLVPFRRRNEYPKNARDNQGFMTLGILDSQDGADPMGPVFAILAGNVRAYGDGLQQAPLEVYLNFDWPGPNQGDASQPFNTIDAATAAVADGGVIKIMPGKTRERTNISGGGKRIKLMAPFGGVTIGTRGSPWPKPKEHWSWGIRTDGDGGDEVTDALSDYRIPPSIHDLFVSDLHRRLHQRLHRFIRSDEDEVGGHRNCDNMEIYAGSPSYLITAGGAPASYAIDPYFLGFPVPGSEKQVGVAVTTTFMPTAVMETKTDLQMPTTYGLYAQHLIQFSSFSEQPTAGPILSGVANYGVAPDFACGHQIRLADWVNNLRLNDWRIVDHNWTFINQSHDNDPGYLQDRPGFYLAIYQENGLGLLEASIPGFIREE
jgi:hypothetical protein